MATMIDWILVVNKEDADNLKFRKFRRQLLHSSLAKMLESLKLGMTTPEVVRCPDGHFRRVIYGIGPYIADYPEQALLACIVQNWCPKYVTTIYSQLIYLLKCLEKGVLQEQMLLMMRSVAAGLKNIQKSLLRNLN
jgi:hypothetical protein